MSNQYGIKEVLNLQVFDYATNNPLFYIDYATTTEIDNTGTRIDLTGGQGNYRLLSFDHSKVSSMKVNLPLVDTTLLATLMGDTVATGAKNVMEREVVTVTAGAATLTQTPLTGTTPAAFFLQGRVDNGTALTKVTSAPAATGEFQLTGKNLTFHTSDNGKQVVVWYQFATPVTSTSFAMKANKFVAPMKLVGDGIARDQVSGTDRAAKITIYNAKFQPNFNLALSSTAASVLDMTLDMYIVNQGSDMVYYDVVFLT